MSPAASIRRQISLDASWWSASVVRMNRSKEMPSFSCRRWNTSEFRRASSAVGMPSAAAVSNILRPRGAGRAAEWDPRVYAAAALHPTRADALTDAARAEIEALAAHPRVVAVGETGMDLYWPGRVGGGGRPGGAG